MSKPRLNNSKTTGKTRLVGRDINILGSQSLFQRKAAAQEARDIDNLPLNVRIDNTGSTRRHKSTSKASKLPHLMANRKAKGQSELTSIHNHNNHHSNLINATEISPNSNSMILAAGPRKNYTNTEMVAGGDVSSGKGRSNLDTNEDGGIVFMEGQHAPVAFGGAEGHVAPNATEPTHE